MGKIQNRAGKKNHQSKAVFYASLYRKLSVSLNIQSSDIAVRSEMVKGLAFRFNWIWDLKS